MASPTTSSSTSRTPQVPKTLRPWQASDSAELYAINHWGNELLSIDDSGDLALHPYAYHGPAHREADPRVSLKALTDDLRKRGISSPMLLRFPDLLSGRIVALNEAFKNAIEEFEYEGSYRGVYPIKVNQDHVVVEQVVAGGAPYHYGLEAGSKPELLAAMALLDDPEALLICNGYKDEYYIQTALFASQLGRRVVIVVEKPSELALIRDVSQRMGVKPCLGVRVKLTARGSGHWKESGGDRSKFGLSARELLDAVEFLRENELLDSLQLLHFHLGSQISAIRSVKNALREASRFYVELVRLGAGLRYLDVGGGLGVDYDGSQTSFHSSMNYSLQEYANDVVYGVGQICEEAGVPVPTLVTEAGRAVTAHHAVLVIDVLGVNALAPSMPAELPEDASSVVKRIWEAQEWLSRKNLIETYHDALQYKEEALSLFNLGHLSLEQRALTESVFWALCARILKIVRDMDHVPEDLENLEKHLSDTYFANFSIFQSLPDAWAVNQLFPIVPLHRLNEEPTRRAVLADITCDSDGQLKQFTDLKDVKDCLELHPLIPGEAYHLGIFLVGAYQEILGDLHNLFGDTNEVHVSVEPSGHYRIEGVERGETVSDVLKYVGYNKEQLVARIRRATEDALREGHISLEQSRRLVNAYEKGLAGYTYLSSPSQ